MRRRTNQQRLVAGLTTLALVVTQVPTAAIAEAVNDSQEAAVATQTQDQGQVETQTESSDEATVEVVEPEQSVEAEQVSNEQTTEVSEENVAEQNADSNAISLASEPVALANSSQDIPTINAHGGMATQADLYNALQTIYSNSGYTGSDGYRLIKDGISEDIYKGSSSNVIGLGGEYEVAINSVEMVFGVLRRETWSSPVGKVKVNFTSKVTFIAEGCDDGGVTDVTNVDSNGQALLGDDVAFTVKSVEGYKVESVTSNGPTVKTISEAQGTYALTVSNYDVEVKVKYKADSSSSLNVVTNNSKVNFLGEDFDKNSHDSVEVAANTEGTLTITPDDGYAVIGVKYNTPDGEVYPELSYKDGVATATIKSPAKDKTGLLTVTTAKCELVTKNKNEDGQIEVGLAACESSVFESLIYNTAIDTENSVPSGDKFSEVTVKYYAGSFLGKEYWENLDYTPGTLEKFVLHAFNSTEGKPEKVRVSYAGDNQYAASSVEFTVKSTDDRFETNLITNNPVTIQYDANKDYMLASLYAQLAPKVYKSGFQDPVSGLTNDDFTITYEDGTTVNPNDVKAGEVTVKVNFAGTKTTNDERGLKPCDTTVTVKVKKAPSSLTVDSKSVTYTGAAQNVREMVSSSPSNEETKPVVLVAGIDGDGKGYVSLDFTYMDSKYVDFLKEQLHVDDGITVGDLSGNLAKLKSCLESIDNYPFVKNALERAGINVDSVKELVEDMQEVVSVLEKLGLNGSTISLFGTPSNAGVYLVAAVTTSDNYKTSLGMGYLYIRKDSESMSLSFSQEMEDKTLSPAEADVFNYGIVTSVLPQGQSAEVTVTFAGTTYAGKPYLKVLTYDSAYADLNAMINEAAPTEPGVYSQTVVVRSTNYRVTPLFRAYAINRVETSIALDGFVDGHRDTVYNGEEQPVTGTVYDADGNVIDDAYVTYLYSGTTFNGETITLSPYAPTEAGEYTVKAVYWGDTTYDYASVEGSFTIERADVKFSLVDIESYYGDEVNHRKHVEYLVNGEEGNGLLTQDEVDAILDTVTCSGDESGHKANSNGYDLTVTIPEWVSANKNLDITVKGAKHVVLQVEAQLVMNDATKIYGEDDPEFSCTLLTADGDVMENQEELLKELDVKFDRVEGEDLGEYTTFATWDEEGNYDVTLVEGTLTIQPALTVTSNAMGTTVVSAKGGAAGTQITVSAIPASDSYEFAGWTVAEGDAVIADATSAQTTVTMGEKNSTVVAKFAVKAVPAPEDKKSDDTQKPEDTKKADETKKSDVKVPNTGVETNYVMPAVIAVLAVLMVVAGLDLKRRNK